MADQVATQEPWSAQQPFLRAVFDQAGALAATPREYFPGQGYVGFSPFSEMAMGMQTQRALAGAPYQDAFGNYLTGALGQGQVNLQGSAGTAAGLQSGLGAGMGALQQTAQGGMLGANPYLDQQFGAASDAVSKRFQDTVMPGINATFGSGGRAGSNAHVAAMGQAQDQLGSQLGNMAANIYGGAYQNERGLQMGAANQLSQNALGGVGASGNLYGAIDQAQSRAGALAPSMAGLEYGNLDRLMNIGGMVDAQSREILADQMNRYNFYRDEPYKNVEWLGGVVGGQGYGGTQTMNQNGQVLGRVLGAAGTGAGIGGAIGGGIGGPLGGGIGAGIGAGVGALGVGLYELFK